MQFDRWTLLFLVRPDHAPQLDGTASDPVQDAHLAYLATMHANGRLLAAGPVQGHPPARR